LLLLASILDTSSFGQINYQVSLASLSATAFLMEVYHTVKTYLAKGNEMLLKQASFLVLLLTSIISLPLAQFNQMPGSVLLIGVVAFSFLQYILSNISSERLGKIFHGYLYTYLDLALFPLWNCLGFIDTSN
jgi:hypothetical protein